MKHIKIARAWGGTGGHIYPIQSLLYFAHKSPHYAYRFKHHYWFGTAQSMEEQVACNLQKDIKNLTFFPIFSGKWRREFGFFAFLKNLADLFKLFVGIGQAMYYLLKLRIDCVFCKGGFVALPVVIAAWLLRKPILVHESDTKPWLVNRIASRFARWNFAAFPQVLPRAKVIGQILDDQLLDQLDEKKTTQKTQLLVMGGSQWAKSLYETLARILHEDARFQDFEITVVLGKLNQGANQLFTPFANVKTLEFCTQSQLGSLYQNADIVLTRAGTTSLAEQELFDIKLIMVPIPRTHDQFTNAMRYVQYKNWILIDQNREDFWSQLQTTLLEHLHYKKTPTARERFAHIQYPKKEILDHLLQSAV